MYVTIGAKWENGCWRVNGEPVSERVSFPGDCYPNELGIKMISNRIWVHESTAYSCEKMVENPQETMNKENLRKLANARRIEAEELRGYLGEYGIEVIRRIEN